MSIRRKTFSASQRARIVIEALKEDKTIAELGVIHEVHPSVIRKWKKHFLENSEVVFDEKRKKTGRATVDDQGELYKQIGQLKVENDFLKKKLGIED